MHRLNPHVTPIHTGDGCSGSGPVLRSQGVDSRSELYTTWYRIHSSCVGRCLHTSGAQQYDLNKREYCVKSARLPRAAAYDGRNRAISTDRTNGWNSNIRHDGDYPDLWRGVMEPRQEPGNTTVATSAQKNDSGVVGCRRMHLPRATHVRSAASGL